MALHPPTHRTNAIQVADDAQLRTDAHPLLSSHAWHATTALGGATDALSAPQVESHAFEQLAARHVARAG
jgi:hypothetical protein